MTIYIQLGIMFAINVYQIHYNYSQVIHFMVYQNMLIVLYIIMMKIVKVKSMQVIIMKIGMGNHVNMIMVGGIQSMFVLMMIFLEDIEIIFCGRYIFMLF